MLITNIHIFLALGLDKKKHADLKTAKKLKGTCQDMCPEKERYVREDRRRLSVWEMVPGTDMVSNTPILQLLRQS